MSLALGSERPVLIVGGGVGGLTALHELRSAGRTALLLEASARLGGNIRTEEHDGFLYDVGPDSFLRTKPAAKELCEALGLGGELISPREQGAQVYVALDGSLHPMPEGLALGVPSRPGPLLETPLLSAAGKARAFLEPFIPPNETGQEESIAAFTRRRLGTEMAARIAAPLLSGVFAGDAERLSLSSAFPQLHAMEQRHGSLFSGMNEGRNVWAALTQQRKRPQNPFLSLRKGLGALISALTQQARAGEIKVSTRVRSVLAPAAGGSAGVLLEDGTRLEAAHVIVAGPPWAAAELLRRERPAAAASLAEIRGAPTATAYFGLPAGAVTFEGSGFIVPAGEGRILAATWVSSKWEGRAPPGTALVRAFLGGARAAESLDATDSELLELAQAELSRFMGPLGRPLFRRLFRYERGTPQPELGHQRRLATFRAELAADTWLSVVGSGYSGVGIPDCVRQAREVVAGLLKGSPRG